MLACFILRSSPKPHNSVDITQHVYGEHRYPGLLVVQDVRTLHGSQFREADLIVASPPCQAYSWRAMPWKKAKAAPPPDNTLFEACFRIQREACEAAGRHIPLIVENVRGAQRFVGRARWNFGSYYLWGDTPALMPIAGSFNVAHNKASGTGQNPVAGRKGSGGSWFYEYGPGQGTRNTHSHSVKRRFLSAMIAKIPAPLARHIAATFRP